MPAQVSNGLSLEESSAPPPMGAPATDLPPSGAPPTTNGWKYQGEVVISGISCRLPESDNMAEFREHLVKGEDMVTDDGRRWEPGKYGMCLVYVNG